jgi:ABC-type Na+ efflux pump permease subunit
MRPHDHGGAAAIDASGASPAWFVVCSKELAELWIGGKALGLILLFCVFQAVTTYLMVSNTADSTPPNEMVYFTIENAIAYGLFMGVILGADTISGERERATLEALLLTPASRLQLVVGKFLAACTPWVVAFAITVPYVAVLAESNEALGHSLLWGAIMGTLLATGFVALGMIVSFWCVSNRSSLFVSLVSYFVFLIPTLLPGGAQAGKYGRLLKRVNPMESNGHFLEKVLVNNRSPREFAAWLTSPIVFTFVAVAVLFLYASPRLRLEAGRAGRSFFGAFAKRALTN